MDRWLRNNNVVKVIALLIGILLWLVVHMDSQTPAGSASPALQEEKINNVTVVPKYDDSQFVIKSIEPTEVAVILRWRDSAFWRPVNTNQIQVELDLNRISGLTAGTHNLFVNTSGIPSSVSPEIIPQMVRVVIEKKEKKAVPVTINVTGTPANGYKAGLPVIQPNRVQVTLPTSLLEGVESARGEINVDKASANVSKQVRLTVFGKDGRPIEGNVNPQLVDVEVPITSPFKVLPLQVKLIGQPAQGFSVASIQQKPEQVTVYAPQDQLNQIDFYEGPQMDINGLKETKQAAMDIPIKNGIGQIDPAKVELNVEIVPSTTKVLNSIPVQINGKVTGTSVRLITPEGGMVSLTLEGAPALLDRLRPQDVQASVDVSNLGPGQHEVPININLPMFIKKPTQTLNAVVEVTIP